MHNHFFDVVLIDEFSHQQAGADGGDSQAATSVGHQLERECPLSNFSNHHNIVQPFLWQPKLGVSNKKTLGCLAAVFLVTKSGIFESGIFF